MQVRIDCVSEFRWCTSTYLSIHCSYYFLKPGSSTVNRLQTNVTSTPSKLYRRGASKNKMCLNRGLSMKCNSSRKLRIAGGGRRSKQQWKWKAMTFAERRFGGQNAVCLLQLLRRQPYALSVFVPRIPARARARARPSPLTKAFSLDETDGDDDGLGTIESRQGDDQHYIHFRQVCSSLTRPDDFDQKSSDIIFNVRT